MRHAQQPLEVELPALHCVDGETLPRAVLEVVGDVLREWLPSLFRVPILPAIDDPFAAERDVCPELARDALGGPVVARPRRLLTTPSRRVEELDDPGSLPVPFEYRCHDSSFPR